LYDLKILTHEESSIFQLSLNLCAKFSNYYVAYQFEENKKKRNN